MSTETDDLFRRVGEFRRASETERLRLLDRLAAVEQELRTRGPSPSGPLPIAFGRPTSTGGGRQELPN